MKTKKIVSFFVTAVIAATSLFAFIGCDSTPQRTDPPQVELTGIEVTKAPTKTKYILGESFDPAGMEVSKVFNNNTKEVLQATDYTYAPSGALRINDKNVTVTYNADSKSYTATVKISVTNEIASVEIVAQPTKTEYIAGELFDPAGMKIQATLENGDKEDAIDVTSEVVTYKTTGLVKSDEHFAMNYGGCDFTVDITVLHGAFLEAEAGQVNGANIEGRAPSSDAIALDYENHLGNVEDAQGHRGIDEGKNCLTVGIGSCCKGPNGCTVDGGRVDIRNYVYNHLEWTETTGGTPAKSGMIQNNHVQFKKVGAKMLYKLTASKAGKVLMTLKMANPHFEGNSSPQNSKAVETKLSAVFKITVGETEVAIPDSVKLAAVDWSEYKAYNKDADYANKSDSDLYTGKLCKPYYYWQNVTVEIAVKEGVNNVTLESLWTPADSSNNVMLDSISCNADADEIMISLNSEFKPVVKTAQVKVADGKVLMGVIVDPQAVGYTDDEITEFLEKTDAQTVSSATYSGNVVGGKNEDGSTIAAGDDMNDPWTQPTDRGGLGYTSAPPMSKLEGSGLNYDYRNKMGGKGKADSVEKITEGDYAGCYIVWFDVTISADDSDKYVGVWTFSNFNYGTNFTASKPAKDILKTDENVTAELGDYCYQVYCDTRSDNVTFGWGNLCLVVQKGSFTGDNACNKLMRRYIGHFEDNDQELIDLRSQA